MGRPRHWHVVLGRPRSWWVLEVGHRRRWWEVFAVRGVGGVPCGCWCWAVLAVGRGRWVVFAVGMGSWWAVFVVRRGSVGADSGPLSSFVGAGSWGGAGPCSPFVGWCWYWAIVVVGGVVMGRCRRWWGGAGPGSSSPMLGVVMGHRLGGWWWALIAVVLCWVKIGR